MPEGVAKWQLFIELYECTIRIRVTAIQGAKKNGAVASKENAARYSKTKRYLILHFVYSTRDETASFGYLLYSVELFYFSIYKGI